MKKLFFLTFLLMVTIWNVILIITSCRKENIVSSSSPPPPLVIDTSFTEEFDSVYKLETKGWFRKDYSGNPTKWVQGITHTCDYKFRDCHGFAAYSYSVTQDEFIYAFAGGNSNFQVDSWLITPVLSVKNGDKISFYTRADSGLYVDRLQVLMNKSSSADVGTFTTTLFDINAALSVSGYPAGWTKYEFTFSGVSGTIVTRIGFRYFLPGSSRASGIGIDLFKFQRQ